jgi:hypothetical protein
MNTSSKTSLSESLTIGLFGTCGSSTFRKNWIKQYIGMGIDFYNPQKGVGEWKEEDAKEEAHHLANDGIILFPVTSEEYSLGSLSEIGFSILNAIRLDERRDFVVYISDTLDDHLNDPTLRKESLKARALVGQHLLKLRLSNLYIVNSLNQMFAISLELHKIAQVRSLLSKFRPRN